MDSNDNKTIHKSLTLGNKAYGLLDSYATRYFQGNMSAAVCFILIKYFEMEETIGATSNTKRQEVTKKVCNTKHTVDLDILKG